MDANIVTDIVVRETGRFSDVLPGDIFPTAPWIGLMKRMEFPKGMGHTISVLTYETNAPLAAETSSTWTTITNSDGVEGGICLPSVEEIPTGSTTRTYSLKRHAIHGPRFCAEDMRTPFAISEQLGAIYGHFQEWVKRRWEMHNRLEYFTYCQRKVVVNPALNETNTMAATYPAFEPSSILTQGVLNKYRAKLWRAGSGVGALAFRGGQPLMTLITDEETSERILFNDDSNNVRADLRDFKPSKLLEPYGVDIVHRGFVHLHDPFPRRFSYNAGTYTEIPAFSAGSPTKGASTDVNSSWESADYQESFIYHPDVMHQLVPDPITRPAPNYKFNPMNYLGQFKVLNIPNETTNPDGTIMRHRAVLSASSKPWKPQNGIAFIHRRCDPKLNLVACS